jgi:hypothetical protein
MNTAGHDECRRQAIRNADFITHSRADMPWMLERIEELEDACREASSTCDGISRSMIRAALAKLDEPEITKGD